VIAGLGTWWIGYGPGSIASTAVLLLAAELLGRGLRSRLGAGVRLWLYVPVLVRCFLPLLPGLPLGPADDAMVLWLDPLRVHGGLPTTTALPALVAWGYLLGVVVVAMPLVRGQLAVRRILSESEPMPVAGLVGASVPVCVHPHEGPFAVGFARPRVVVPAHLIDDPRLAHVLRHEAAHVARGDLALWWALMGVRTLFWPVLPVWLAGERILRLVEIAADAHATRGLDRAHRLAYGEALIRLATSRPRAGVGLSTFHALEERVMNLRHPVVVHPLASIAGALLAIGLTVAACADVPNDLPGEAPAIEGALEAPAIDDTIRPHMPSIVACYQRALADQPELAGKVVVGFVIDESGAVRDAGVDKSTLDAPSVRDCLVDVVETVTFPPPSGGNVRVAYPFVFEPG